MAPIKNRHQRVTVFDFTRIHWLHFLGLLGGVVKSAVIPAIVGIRINLGPNTTLLVRILDSRLRGNDGNMQLTTLPNVSVRHLFSPLAFGRRRLYAQEHKHQGLRQLFYAVKVPLDHPSVQVPLAFVVVAVEFVGNATQEAYPVIASEKVGGVEHLAEVAVPLILPAMGYGDGLDHVGRCPPALFRRLVQVAHCQVFPALSQELAGLGGVVGYFFKVGRSHGWLSSLGMPAIGPK